jgi:hypothetical protein
MREVVLLFHPLKELQVVVDLFLWQYHLTGPESRSVEMVVSAII